MSSKKKSKQTIQFNPAGLAAYNALQPQIQAGLTNDMQFDPTQSATYNLALQQMTRAVQNLGAKRQNVFLNNLVSRGISPSAGFVQSQTERLGRMTDAEQAQGTIQNYLNFDAQRRQAQAQAMSYRPLQTGAEGEEKTSGLGTWLPQAASAGLQVGAGMMSAPSLPSPYGQAVQSIPLTRPQLPTGWAGTPVFNGANSGSYFNVFPNAPVVTNYSNPFLFGGR